MQIPPKIRPSDRSNSKNQLPTAEQNLWSLIEALDLHPVREELIRTHVFYRMHVHSGLIEYRKFLFLQGAYIRADGDGCGVFVPPDEISEIWHTHILMTRRYAEDCEYLFGRFLHHGYEPPPGSDVYLLGVEAFKRLYRDRFGEPPTRFTYRCQSLDREDFKILHRRAYEARGGTL